MALTDADEKEIRRQLVALGPRRVSALLKVTRNNPGIFGGPILLAIGSRESGLKNIVGDGGHGRGVFQMDDRWQADWLGRVRGALSGSWNAVSKSALRSGYVPLFVPSLRRARRILVDNYTYLIENGIPAHLAKKAAVSAYNCGPGNVKKAWDNGKDLDYYTTGGNYAKDVFERRDVVRDWLKEEGF